MDEKKSQNQVNNGVNPVKSDERCASALDGRGSEDKVAKCQEVSKDSADNGMSEVFNSIKAADYIESLSKV